MKPIYLDNNATTRIDPAVLDRVVACLADGLGNPSSIHMPGQRARLIVDEARARVARSIGARPEEIVFTGGGTESNNIAVLGAVNHIGSHCAVATSAVEHQSVLNPCQQLADHGHRVTFVPVDREGRVNPEEFLCVTEARAGFVSLMLANNDSGTIEPVTEVCSLLGPAILVHTDAVQALGKIPIDVNELGVDLLSISSHKIHGPPGVGALFVRRGVKLVPLSFGGHQEHALRPGTENVPAIAGFGLACEIAGERVEHDMRRVATLRDRLEELVLTRIDGTRVNGSGADRLANTSNIAFGGLDGEFIAINLDLFGLSVSTGAACATVDQEPSHVLTAMGLTWEQARSSLRFSLSRNTTEEDIECAVELIERVVDRLS